MQMDPNELCSAVESILFAAESPISVKRFQQLFTEEEPEAPKPTKKKKAKAKATPPVEAKEDGEGESPVEDAPVEVSGEDETGEPTPVELFPADAIETALESLMGRYAEDDRGFELRRANNGYHFVTKPKNVKWVQKFLATKPFRLGKSALEVMSIVAYRQPVTRADIDKVRGIDSGHLLRVLMERGLVKMAGKAEVPGRPVQYGTTPKFLETVGLTDLTELPPLSELTELQGERPTKDPLEEGLERFVRSTQDPEKLEEATQEELAEINEMISEADSAQEVYESATHEAVAAANVEAIELAAGKKRKKTKSKADVIAPDSEVSDAPAEASAENQASDEAKAPAVADEAPQEVSYQDLVSSENGDSSEESAADLVAGPPSFDADQAMKEFDADADTETVPEPEDTANPETEVIP